MSESGTEGEKRLDKCVKWCVLKLLRICLNIQPNGKKFLTHERNPCEKLLF